MHIIDTHLHLIYPDRFSYPWLNGEPGLNRPWHLEAYRREAEALGIVSALHMEVDVAEPHMVRETEFVLGLDAFIAGAVAACRPEHQDFPAQLEALPDGVVGLRRVLHVVDDEISTTALFRENIRRLATAGLTFDICMRADQLPLAIALIDAAPDVTFIIDHCGVPDVAAGAIEPWRTHMRELARRSNAHAKISGIVAYAAPDWNLNDLRAFATPVIDAFGFERIVWGSDHPVCTSRASLSQWIKASRALVASASSDEQAQLFHRNAERIYGIRRA